MNFDDPLVTGLLVLVLLLVSGAGTLFLFSPKRDGQPSILRARILIGILLGFAYGAHITYFQGLLVTPPSATAMVLASLTTIAAWAFTVVFIITQVRSRRPSKTTQSAENVE